MTRLFFLCFVTMMRLRQSRGVIKYNGFVKIRHFSRYFPQKNNLTDIFREAVWSVLFCFILFFAVILFRR